MTNHAGSRPIRSRALLDVAALFLRLGCTAFGGPAAHISMMESEVVRRRRWLSPERFLDLFGAANLIPGPSSSELAVYIGYEHAGLLGLVVAGVCFVMPAALITGVLAWLYVHYGRLPQVSGVLYGIKPVIIVIIAQALFNLVPKAAKNTGLIASGLLALLAAFIGVDPVLTIFIVGALMMLVYGLRKGSHGANLALIVPGSALGIASAGAPVTLLGIFAFFLKIGSIVFGSGYVLLAFLRADLVERWHWLTESQLLDAITVGQVTPGPVFTTATFIGYVLAGIPGALLATLGIFLPGFVLVAVSRPLLKRVRQSALLGAFLDGVNVAALALMAHVTMTLARAALLDLGTVFIAGVAALLLFRWKLNSAWLIVLGAGAGLLLRSLH